MTNPTTQADGVPRMTADHVAMIQAYVERMKESDRCARLNAMHFSELPPHTLEPPAREILLLVRSLASGERDTYDTRTHRAVGVKELRTTAQSIARLADGKRGDSAVFSRLFDVLTRWLSPSPCTDTEGDE